MKKKNLILISLFLLSLTFVLADDLSDLEALDNCFNNGGFSCEAGETCDGTFVETDFSNCCIGTCSGGSGSDEGLTAQLDDCFGNGGKTCLPEETCNGQDIGNGMCCIGTCIEGDSAGSNDRNGFPTDGDFNTNFDGFEGDAIGGNIFLTLMAIILPFIILFMIIGFAMYIYTALAYMKIANKIGTPNGWLAWIPIANFFLIAKMARSHWWPILLFLTYFLAFIPVLVFIPLIAMFIFIIFLIIWHWKIFESVGMGGWWSLMILIPFIGTIIFAVGLGIAAWGNNVGQQATAEQEFPKEEAPSASSNPIQDYYAAAGIEE